MSTAKTTDYIVYLLVRILVCVVQAGPTGTCQVPTSELEGNPCSGDPTAQCIDSTYCSDGGKCVADLGVCDAPDGGATPNLIAAVLLGVAVAACFMLHAARGGNDDQGSRAKAAPTSDGSRDIASR